MERLDQFLKLELGNDKQIANRLAEQLTWMIASGQIKTGERLPSVRELARQLGIHLHTVRAAYRKMEESRLIVTRQGLGSVVLDYDSLSLADHQNSVPTHTVGIIIPDMANPFYPELVSGIEEVARANHILMITCDTQDDHRKGREYLDLLIAKRVDGLIIAPYGLCPNDCDHQSGEPAFTYPVPIVYVDRPEISYHAVLLDAAGAGYAATRHLFEHGHEQVAIITGRRDVVTLQQCYSGYLQACSEYNRPVDPDWVFEVDKFSFEAGYHTAHAMLERKGHPSAIFIAGDLLAVGAMRAFREHGLRIPEDVAVIGYNDIPLSAYLEPALTSVRTPTRELGAAAMQRLYRLINGEDVDSSPTVLTTELIIRDSCGCSQDKRIL